MREKETEEVEGGGKAVALFFEIKAFASFSCNDVRKKRSFFLL